MKIKVFFLTFFPFIILFLFPTFPANAAVYWQENFNSFTKNWTCCLTDCALNPGLPTGYSEFHAETVAPDYGECNSQITVDANYGSAGANNRGYRWYLEEKAGTGGENLIKKSGVNISGRFFLRWYQRMSDNMITSNFLKLFRIGNSATPLVPEWKGENGHVYMNVWAGGPNNLFYNYMLDEEYNANTWVCYELEFNTPGNQATFWVNGVNKGTIAVDYDTTSIPYFTIGGNHAGTWWSQPAEQTIDYDELVIADQYIGPISTQPNTPPAAPTGVVVR